MRLGCTACRFGFSRSSHRRRRPLIRTLGRMFVVRGSRPPCPRRPWELPESHSKTFSRRDPSSAARSCRPLPWRRCSRASSASSPPFLYLSGCAVRYAKYRGAMSGLAENPMSMSIAAARCADHEPASARGQPPASVAQPQGEVGNRFYIFSMPGMTDPAQGVEHLIRQPVIGIGFHERIERLLPTCLPRIHRPHPQEARALLERRHATNGTRPGTATGSTSVALVCQVKFQSGSSLEQCRGDAAYLVRGVAVRDQGVQRSRRVQWQWPAGGAPCAAQAMLSTRTMPTGPPQAHRDALPVPPRRPIISSVEPKTPRRSRCGFGGERR